MKTMTPEEMHAENLQHWREACEDPLWVTGSGPDDGLCGEPPRSPESTGRYKIFIQIPLDKGAFTDPIESWAYWDGKYWFRSKRESAKWQKESKYLDEDGELKLHPPKDYSLEWTFIICGWKQKLMAVEKEG